MAKIRTTDDITLTEAKLAMEYLKTYGGKESIVDYLQPLRKFLEDFGTLERFDYVIEKTYEALGKEAISTKPEEVEEVVNSEKSGPKIVPLTAE